VKALLAVAVLLVAPEAFAQAPRANVPSINGLWDAVIVAAGTEVPFRFEIATTGSAAQGVFFEGDQKVGSTSGSFVSGALKLEYDHLNTTLELALGGDRLTGTYRNNRPNARPQV
jgi:hypothetical protein